MDDAAAARMTPGEIDEFLGSAGTGVLALAREDEPYAIPVSYGYDPRNGDRRLYLRLGGTAESEKRRFLPADAARLVVYRREGDTWTSVVARGPLGRLDESDIDAGIVRSLREAALPLRPIFDVPDDELAFELYALRIEELTGRSAPALDESRSGR